MPIDTNAYIDTMSVTVLGNTGSLVRTDYTFAGWNTLANGLGTGYDQGDTFSMGAANVTLYAVWTPAAVTYNVTYDGNGSTGGVVPTDATDYDNGDLVTVLGNTGSLVCTGYTFDGWNTAANGTGTGYAPGDDFNMGTADVILYAQWTADLAFTSTSLPVGTAGTPYSYAITATGGKGSKTYAVTAGTLPSGLTLATGGLLSGMPANAYTGSFTVTVTDSSMTPKTLDKQFSITIKAKPVEAYLLSLTLTPPAKLTYLIGEGLDTSGMKVTANYSDGTSRDVTANAAVSGFDSTAAGKKTVTVSYSGKTATFEVEVQTPPVVLREIKVVPPTKKLYFLGDAFDTAGLKVTAVYSEGTTKDVTSQVGLAGFDSQTEGTKTITVSHEGVTATFTVKVKAASVTKLVVTPPITTVYEIGDTFDPEGLKVTAVYDDGSREDATDEVVLSGFDSSTSGTKTIQVSYSGATATFQVTVQGTLLRIELENIGYNESTYFEYEVFNPGELRVIAVYSDGRREDVTREVTYGGYAADGESDYVTVMYNGQTASFNIIVFDTDVSIDLKKMYIEKLPDKLVYNLGEQFDSTGLQVMGEFKSLIGKKTVKDITSIVIMKGFDSITPGKKVIKVKLQQHSASFTVEVREPVIVSLALGNGDMVMKKGARLNIKVTGTASDGSTYDITKMCKFNVIRKGIAKVNDNGLLIAKNKGKTDVTVKYGDLEIVFNVRIEK